MAEKTDTPVLIARDLTVDLAGDAGPVRVLDGVSLELSAAEIVDVIGPSGSGKSTLLRALARLLPGVDGSLELAGAHVESPQQWRRQVALVTQKPVLAPGSVSESLLHPWGMSVRRGDDGRPREERMRELLDRLGLGDVSLLRDVARLSVGQQARISLARTLLTGPRVLLLDEADAALDEESVAAVGAAVKRFAEGGAAVVRVRHRGPDGLETRRVRLIGGHLTEVTE